MLEVPDRLRRTAHQSQEDWLESARQLVDLVQRQTGRSDLATTSVLDVGCGTKIVKVLLDDGLPIDRYVGIDVDPDVIELLESSVDDPRFQFHHIDVKNDRYNPDGLPLEDRNELPLGDERFDIIWLFSVFTHLAPNDYSALLRVLRRYVRDDGWLVFSLYVNELTGTGFAPLDWREHAAHAGRPQLAIEVERQRAERGEEWFWKEFDHQVAVMGYEWFAAELSGWMEIADEDTRAELQRRLDEHGPGPVAPDARKANAAGRAVYADESGALKSEGDPPDFVDLIPEEPLVQAVYSRKHAYELLEGTGWEVVSLNPPEPQYIQHYFVCRPA